MVRNTLWPQLWTVTLAAFLAFPAFAQEDPYDSLKRNVEAFAGMLEQALELDGGLFGLGGERIDSLYLAGHGLVLEGRSDLAIAQAGEYARILRDAGGVDDDAFERLRVEIESLRQKNRDGVERLRELTEESSASALEQGERFERALSELTAEMEQLRERAVELADDLRERSESAQLERAERWRQDVASLELRLTGAMCEYGASLRELPANENITVVLNGLGGESSGGGRADLVHTFGKSDLLLCAEGDIGPAALGERSGRYSY